MIFYYIIGLNTRLFTSYTEHPQQLSESKIHCIIPFFNSLLANGKPSSGNSNYR